MTTERKWKKVADSKDNLHKLAAAFAEKQGGKFLRFEGENIVIEKDGNEIEILSPFPKIREINS